MKKGRLGFKLSLLCEQDQVDAMEKIIFEETGAIGCRLLEVEKHELGRELVPFDYMNHRLQLKRVYFRGAALKYKVENDDLKALALSTGIPLREVGKRVGLYLEENDLWKTL